MKYIDEKVYEGEFGYDDIRFVGCYILLVRNQKELFLLHANAVVKVVRVRELEVLIVLLLVHEGGLRFERQDKDVVELIRKQSAVDDLIDLRKGARPLLQHGRHAERKNSLLYDAPVILGLI